MAGAAGPGPGCSALQHLAQDDPLAAPLDACQGVFVFWSLYFQTFLFSFSKPKKFLTLFFLPIGIINCLKSISSPAAHLTLTGLGGHSSSCLPRLLSSPAPGPAGTRAIGTIPGHRAHLCFPSRVPARIQTSA